MSYVDYLPTNGQWNTQDEMDFVQRLGQHSHGLYLGQREELLRGYIRSLDLRPNPPFDAQRVRVLAQRLLKIEVARLRALEERLVH